MATVESLAIRREAAMRQIENGLSHFAITGTMPRRGRNQALLHIQQLEFVGNALTQMAHKVIMDAIAEEEAEEALEAEFARLGQKVMGVRSYIPIDDGDDDDTDTD